MNMDTNGRIEMIRAKKERMDEEAFEKKRQEHLRVRQLAEQIAALRDRIRAVIEVGNALLENGFLDWNTMRLGKDKRLEKYGYYGGMIADGIRHYVGFMYRYNESCGRVCYLGIRMGGACGVYNFYTNGCATFSRHEKAATGFGDPIESHMKQFLCEFPQFEAALYAWVDENMK